MAQHTKAVLKSVSIAPVDPTGEKGCCFAVNLFLQLPRVNICGKTIPHRIYFQRDFTVKLQ